MGKWKRSSSIEWPCTPREARQTNTNEMCDVCVCVYVEMCGYCLGMVCVNLPWRRAAKKLVKPNYKWISPDHLPTLINLMA